MIDESQFNPEIRTVKGRINLAETIFAKTREVTLSFSLDQPAMGYPLLWPKDLEERGYHYGANEEDITEFETVKQDVAIRALNRGIFDEVSDWVIENCTTHEAARYLFPPYLAILRKADMSYTANEVETIKRAPTLPVLPYMMREKMRHAIQWFAIQELLGTFEQRHVPKSKTDIEVTLAGNVTLLREDEDGRGYTIQFHG
jgi:hypothetical protein